MLSDKAMFERMQKGWRGGLRDGTVCGNGSTLAHTRHIRDWLPQVCKKHHIQTVCDAGAGDLHWIHRVDWDVDYKAYDLIPRNPSVQRLDVTTEALPTCDAILCRMVLNHLCRGDDWTRVDMAVALFRQSAKYLIATHFVDGGARRADQFSRLDLVRLLGEPIEMCQDGHETNCRLAIWSLR